MDPSLVIFDKDGTLIDLEEMWASWVPELVRRLDAATGLSLASALSQALAVDPDSGIPDISGPLSVAPVAELRRLTRRVLRDAGLSAGDADAAMVEAWHTPDPIESARPLTDLERLFSALRACGLRIAVATSDDRLPTQATLAELGLTSRVDALACGDDGPPIKPAPDMVLTICRTLALPPARAVVVGDDVADLKMGRAAGVGLVVGVLSGISSHAVLTPHADLLLPSVSGLVQNSGSLPG
jgi:phosphoglycolate phosphatase